MQKGVLGTLSCAVESEMHCVRQQREGCDILWILIFANPIFGLVEKVEFVFVCKKLSFCYTVLLCGEMRAHS